MPCTARSVKELPAYDHVEVEAAADDEMFGAPVTYRLDGATAADVMAFAVSGPPNENWIPIRQFGKSD